MVFELIHQELMRTEEEGFTNVVAEWFLGGSLAVDACEASQRLGPVLPARVRSPSPPPSPQRSPQRSPQLNSQPTSQLSNSQPGSPPPPLLPSPPGAGMGTSPVVEDGGRTSFASPASSPTAAIDSPFASRSASFLASPSALVAVSASTEHDEQHDDEHDDEHDARYGERYGERYDERYNDEYRRDGGDEEQPHEHGGGHEEQTRECDANGMDTVYEGTREPERSEWSHEDNTGRGYEHDGGEGGVPLNSKTDGADRAYYDHADSSGPVAAVATTMMMETAASTMEAEAEAEAEMEMQTGMGTSVGTSAGTNTGTGTGGDGDAMDADPTENAWLFEHHHGVAFTDD